MIIDIKKSPEKDKEFIDSGYEFFYFGENGPLQVCTISEKNKGQFIFWGHSDCNIDFYNECEEIPLEEKEKILQVYCNFHDVSISDYTFKGVE